MPAVEYVSGSESHTSYWGKFYVKGLESVSVKEDDDANERGKHASYQFWMAEARPGAVFTVFEQDGNKRGTDNWTYRICVASEADQAEIKANYGRGRISGQFAVIAQGEGKIRAPRLMDWWDKKPANVDPLVWAAHLRDNIDKRGMKEPPALELTSAGVAA